MSQKYYLLVEIEVENNDENISDKLLDSDCVVEADGVVATSVEVVNVYQEPLPPYM